MTGLSFAFLPPPLSARKHCTHLFAHKGPGCLIDYWQNLSRWFINKKFQLSLLYAGVHSWGRSQSRLESWQWARRRRRSRSEARSRSRSRDRGSTTTTPKFWHGFGIRVGVDVVQSRGNEPGVVTHVSQSRGRSRSVARSRSRYRSRCRSRNSTTTTPKSCLYVEIRPLPVVLKSSTFWWFCMFPFRVFF